MISQNRGIKAQHVHDRVVDAANAAANVERDICKVLAQHFREETLIGCRQRAADREIRRSVEKRAGDEIVARRDQQGVLEGIFERVDNRPEIRRVLERGNTPFEVARVQQLKCIHDNPRRSKTFTLP